MQKTSFTSAFLGLEAIIKGFQKKCLIKTCVNFFPNFSLEQSELFKAEEKTKKCEKTELV